MSARLRTVRDELRSGFFLVPCLMTLSATLLAVLMVWADGTETVRQLAALGVLYDGGPNGATILLSTIAGSLISVAGTTYAVTIAVLTFASSQFGPRLLRNFLRDRANQLVLGAYVATFVYSLVVLRSIGDPGGGSVGRPNLVPHASVAGAMLGEAICVGLLIYFIHHVAVSIQAPAVIAGISRDLMRSIRQLYPGTMGYEPPPDHKDNPAADLPPQFDHEAARVSLHGRGYVQAIDERALIRIASTRDIIIRLELAPGDYVSAGNTLARIWPPGRSSPDLVRALNGVVALGWERTQLQDVEYHLNQLVEIAMRALSPAINDPFTAMQCVDRLTEALSVVAQLDPPSPYRYDRNGKLRVVATEAATFETLASICFDSIRRYGVSSVDVSIRLLDGLATIAPWVRHPADLAVLQRQAEMIERGAQLIVPDPWDQQQIRERCQRVTVALGTAPSGDRGPTGADAAPVPVGERP